MNENSLRKSITILTLFTAIIHLILLNLGIYQDKGTIDPLFTLNGIGYLVFLAAFAGRIPQLVGKEKLVHYGFILYALATIGAFLALGDMASMFGWVTKTSELLLVIALWLHLKKIEA